jgi:hypothetical protein
MSTEVDGARALLARGRIKHALAELERARGRALDRNDDDELDEILGIARSVRAETDGSLGRAADTLISATTQSQRAVAGRPQVAVPAVVPPVVETGSRGLSRTEQLFVALGAHAGMIAVAFGVFIVVVLGAAGSNGSDRDVELAFLIPGLLWGAVALLIAVLWLARMRRTAWLIAPSVAWTARP